MDSISFINCFSDPQIEKAAKEIYEYSFPADEKWDWKYLRDAAHNAYPDGCLEFNAIVSDERGVIGICTTVSNGSITYLFYLAVRKDLRDHGYGGRILDIFKSRFGGTRCFLEAESLKVPSEDRPMRERHFGFYARNGLLPTDLSINEYGVDYDILSLDGKKIDFDEYLSMMQLCFRGIPVETWIFKADL